MQKYLTLLILYLSGFFMARAQESKLIITHLTGDFYICTSFKSYDGTPFPSNCMYMLSTDGAVLFDTPVDSTQFQPLLDSIEARHHMGVTLCISTHYHDDRTAGLEYYKNVGINTFSSQATRELCRKFGEKVAEFTFSDDAAFRMGSHAFETFYPGEGHTPDNIVIWFAKEKILYGGCLVKSTEAKGLGNVADANLAAWPVTIQRLINKYPDAAFVIPGHMKWSGKEALQHTLDLLQKSK